MDNDNGYIQPCPFCGGYAKVVFVDANLEDWLGNDRWRVYCTECAAEIDRDSQVEATIAWNSRAVS